MVLENVRFLFYKRRQDITPIAICVTNDNEMMFNIDPDRDGVDRQLLQSCAARGSVADFYSLSCYAFKNRSTIIGSQPNTENVAVKLH